VVSVWLLVVFGAGEGGGDGGVEVGYVLVVCGCGDGFCWGGFVGGNAGVVCSAHRLRSPCAQERVGHRTSKADCSYESGRITRGDHFHLKTFGKKEDWR